MKRLFPSLLLGILFLTLQSTWLTFPLIHRIRPDLVLILTLYLGLSYPPISGGILALFLGYLTDLFSGNSLGLYTFSRPVLFYIAQLFKGRIYLENYASQSLLIFILTMVEGFLILIFVKALNPEFLRNLIPLSITAFLLHSLFTALLSPFFFSLLNKGSFLFFNHYRFGIGEKE